MHHTQFRTNYSLFMPFYDYVYGTVDKSVDVLYEKSVTRPEETPDVVYLTHLATPDSVYHMRLGFASLASKPYNSKSYLRVILWPLTFGYTMLFWIFSPTFVLERNHLDKLKLQTWVIPKYRLQVRISHLLLLRLIVILGFLFFEIILVNNFLKSREHHLKIVNYSYYLKIVFPMFHIFLFLKIILFFKSRMNRKNIFSFLYLLF